MNVKKEEEFILVNFSDNEYGLLKTFGKREVVANVRVLDGADEADNVWLAEQIKQLYQQYYSRVISYLNKEV